jgi:predicted Zn finger-like uncharacterized protein
LIAACPQCRTRYRLAREKIGAQGARIRCSSCQTVFRVQAPEAGSPPTPAEARPSPLTAAPPKPAPVAPPAPVAAPKPQAPLAVAIVAEPDADLAKRLADFLGRWRIASEIVEDGGEALLQMFRCPPQLVVLGANLPSLSAPKVAEIAKRSGELAGVKLVHVAIASEPPISGYEADEALEPGDLPNGLSALLAKFGLGAKPNAGPAPAPAAPSMRPAAAPAPAARPLALAPAAKPVPSPAAKPAPGPMAKPAASADPDIAAAERLARIAVSDVILYNEAKFAAAIAAGNVAKALANELEEARAHFNSRVSPILRQSRDFLREELERRAAQRKG